MLDLQVKWEHLKEMSTLIEKKTDCYNLIKQIRTHQTNEYGINRKNWWRKDTQKSLGGCQTIFYQVLSYFQKPDNPTCKLTDFAARGWRGDWTDSLYDVCIFLIQKAAKKSHQRISLLVSGSDSAFQCKKCRFDPCLPGEPRSHMPCDQKTNENKKIEAVL